MQWYDRQQVKRDLLLEKKGGKEGEMEVKVKKEKRSKGKGRKGLPLCICFFDGC